MKNKKKRAAEDKRNPHQEEDSLGLDTETPSNYENSLGGHPKNLTEFEVDRSPGRL
ncbi:hypothetical protein ACFOUO_05350 [Salinithrix halophila]|uniref:Uncharacterized protein n=1 Tax=Salinithrix halophila TaxID=1485204 RepID=A0ABV8JC91_9BACL